MNSSENILISGSGLWKSFKSGDETVSIIKGLDFSLLKGKVFLLWEILDRANPPC